MGLTLQTPVIELQKRHVGRLTAYTSTKLASSLAAYSEKSEPADVTVEDLLNYFPMRYEDRSNFVRIDQLQVDVDASVELYTRTSHVFDRPNRFPPKSR